MQGLIGHKVGMTQIWDNEGRIYPVTVIQAGPCVIAQVKTAKTDGYEAIQLGFEDLKASHAKSPIAGHFKKIDATPKRHLKEFRSMEIGDKKAGDDLTVKIFAEGDLVDVIGTSKGHGFTGVMKRHNFKGGHRSHGKSDQLRAAGSIGASSDPSRVLPGVKMAGRHGGTQITTRNLKIVRVDAEKNLIMVRGAVPGSTSSLVYITK